MNYLLSILIPTRNRELYVKETVKQILSLRLNNVQIIISDNSDRDTLSTEWKDIPNVKYLYTPLALSFVDNFSLATAAANGEYLFAIGDDDGILPAILPITEFASKNNIDAITPSLNMIYAWPGSHIIKNHDDGILGIDGFKMKVMRTDTRNQVEKLLKNGCLDYLKFHLAKIYHGIVKKSLVEELKLKAGNYFKGLTPDIYSSVALSMLAKNTFYIDCPVSISGMCPKSGSADSANGRHTGDINSAPHFKGHEHYEWNAQVPKVYTVETIWAESALTALNDLGEKDFAEKFNLFALAAKLYKNYPQFNSETSQCLESNYCKVDAFMFRKKALFMQTIKNVERLGLRIIKKCFRTEKTFKRYYNVATISDAYKAGCDYLKLYNKNVDKLLKNLSRALKEA